MEVRFVKREDIEKIKWDSCVHYANEGNIFGYTWYLDNVAREWDGLVEGDYVSVFPLIKTESRAGVPSLHIPELLPKAGIYSVHLTSHKRVNAFLKSIPEEYKIQEYAFSKRITLTENHETETVDDYEIDLNVDYEKIYEGYSQELLDGLKAIQDDKLIVDSSVKPEAVVDLYMAHAKGAKEENKHAYLRIMYNLMHRGTGFVSAVTSAEGELMAADFFTYSHGKTISLIPCSKGGKAKFALWKLTDLMLQTQSGKPAFFDFNTQMGNINPTLFGAKKVNYTVVRENKLKGWKKWINKI